MQCIQYAYVPRKSIKKTSTNPKHKTQTPDNCRRYQRLKTTISASVRHIVFELVSPFNDINMLRCGFACVWPRVCDDHDDDEATKQLENVFIDSFCVCVCCF